ncbi:MAG: NAD(P)/FAD-dependent oxidoreductase [Planctomycetota bacterium]
MSHRHRVVVVGGGFGGLCTVRALRRAPVEVTLLDRRNFHLFQPLLYQVATGGLSPGNIATPLRKILKRQKNARVLLGEVSHILAAERKVQLTDSTLLEYDFLVIAAGSENHYFNHPEWELLAPGLKSIEDATEIRRRIYQAFEMAERLSDPEEIRAWLSFVVVGGGATGVELAGTLGEITRDTLKHDFRHIDPTDTHIILVEGTDRVLPPFHAKLSRKATASLKRLGVQVRTDVLVSQLESDRVTLGSGDHAEVIPTRTVIWAAGVKASSLGASLRDSAAADLDPLGRVRIGPSLTLRGHPEIFVIGDMAHCLDSEGRPLPGVAPVAIQQGQYVARSIRRRLGGEEMPPFSYKNRGSMATVGRASAVAEMGQLKLSGYPAWLAWLFIHLALLIGFENRLLVLVQWAWCYFTYSRGARLILGGVEAGSERRQSGVRTGSEPN